MCVTTRPVLTYILNHPDSWKNDFAEKHIKVKYKDNLAIFNYAIGADFNDEIVRDARGIIIDLANMRIVCYPFTKFGNYFESYADNINWNTALVQEKIDGSIVKLYYYQNEWHWATNSCIDAGDAAIEGTSRSFLDVILTANNYQDIDFENLDKNCTYIFELVSPSNQIVVHYSSPHLYHLGTRSNISGLEYSKDIGIEKPKLYALHSYDLENVIEMAEYMNENGVVKHEGFVVVDADYNRIKIKNPEYLKLHHNMSARVLTKRDALETLIFNDEERMAAIATNLRLNVQLKWYEYQLAAFVYQLDLYISNVRALYIKLNNDRKAFAMSVKNDTFKSFAFMAIDRMGQTAQEIIYSIPVSYIKNFIEDYVGE